MRRIDFVPLLGNCCEPKAVANRSSESKTRKPKMIEHMLDFLRREAPHAACARFVPGGQFAVDARW